MQNQNHDEIKNWGISRNAEAREKIADRDLPTAEQLLNEVEIPQFIFLRSVTEQMEELDQLEYY